MSLDRLTYVDSLYSITKKERKIIAEKKAIVRIRARECCVIFSQHLGSSIDFPYSRTSH